MKTYKSVAKDLRITQRSTENQKKDVVRGKLLKVREAEWKLNLHNSQKIKLEQHLANSKLEYRHAKAKLEGTQRLQILNNRPRVDLENLLEMKN